jgi:hypothetical protein
MSKAKRNTSKRVHSVSDVAKRAIQRWADAERMPVADVELISADRLSTPLTGDRVSDRWNNNFQWAG